MIVSLTSLDLPRRPRLDHLNASDAIKIVADRRFDPFTLVVSKAVCFVALVGLR